MSTLSTLRPIIRTFIINNGRISVPIREMSGDHHKLFPFQPTRFQYTKFKDLLNLYFWVGVIPLAVITFAVNVFVGPATLTEVPAGYTPKHWEYHSHPVTRFLSKYIFTNPQQDYEKYMHYLFEEDEKLKIRALETEIKKKIKERRDFQSYYYRPIMAKYYRKTREEMEKIGRIAGD